MKYRILIRPEWTFKNNSPNKRWKVQYLFLNLIWLSTSDTWYTREDAEQWIKDTRKEY